MKVEPVGGGYHVSNYYPEYSIPNPSDDRSKITIQTAPVIGFSDVDSISVASAPYLYGIASFQMKPVDAHNAPQRGMERSHMEVRDRQRDLEQVHSERYNIERCHELLGTYQLRA